MVFQAMFSIDFDQNGHIITEIWIFKSFAV